MPDPDDLNDQSLIFQPVADPVLSHPRSKFALLGTLKGLHVGEPRLGGMGQFPLEPIECVGNICPDVVR